jgi:tRNA pseudouridine55 synthase
MIRNTSRNIPLHDNDYKSMHTFLSTSNLFSHQQQEGYPQNQHQHQHQHQQENQPIQETIPTHLAEGICAVNKPIGWTSQDVVSYLRGMLERDARSRGVVLPKRSGKSKRKVKVGHGGTLDPLATGVLVIGIGSGTKELQHYLQGSKKYRAGVELGFETDTLDMEGKRVKEMDWEHVREDDIQSVLLQQFTGTIMQKPPLYSAIRKNGKRLYEQAREGKTEADLEIEARPVEIYNLGYYLTQDQDGTPNTLPCFGLDVECGGGTYIRSLVRDLGNALGTCATMTSLIRTQQGPFTLEDALPKEEWSPEIIYGEVEKWNEILSKARSTCCISNGKETSR